jgi:hypothetical protein
VDGADWLTRTNPKQMLEFLKGEGSASDRKFLLFAVACCRRIWPLLGEHRSRQAVDLLDRCLDEGPEHLAIARELAEEGLSAPGSGYGAFAPWQALRRGSAHARAREAAVSAARAVGASVSLSGVNGDQETFDAERRVQSDLLRCLFGNPFRPAPPLPPAVLAWNDRTVPRLAAAAYDDRRLPEGTLSPSHLGVLHDALLDAGCEDAALLEHLRSEGHPHYRGCWSVDLVLGRC